MENFEDLASGRPMPPSGMDPAAAGLLLLLDEWAHGVLLAHVDGRVLHANHAAHQALQRQPALSLRDHRLHAATPEAADQLHQALVKAAGGRRSLLTLGGPEPGAGPTLTLAALPLRNDGEGEQASVALVFSRASVCDALMLCFFARSHRLTGAEEQVLGILCQGCSAPEVARQLRVAVSTVRSHVRSMCAKTGSRSVRQLLQKVAILPPVAPAIRQQPVH